MVKAGQVLVTLEDTEDRRRYLNSRATMETLLGLGCVPIVNENDTVATDEIRFGDNDRLAALVAHVVQADALVLLSDVEGLYDGPPSREGATLITDVRGPEDLDGVRVGGTGGAGVGAATAGAALRGMRTTTSGLSRPVSPSRVTCSWKSNPWVRPARSSTLRNSRTFPGHA